MLICKIYQNSLGKQVDKFTTNIRKISLDIFRKPYLAYFKSQSLLLFQEFRKLFYRISRKPNKDLHITGNAGSLIALMTRHIQASAAGFLDNQTSR